MKVASETSRVYRKAQSLRIKTVRLFSMKNSAAYSTVVIIDIECTCNDDPSIVREEMEIIEVGAIAGQLSQDGFELTDKCQIYVQPQIHTQLTAFCKQLTGIDQSTVDGTASLDMALTQLNDWLLFVAPAAWCSWGKFDQRQFELETELKQLPNPLAHLPYFNIKQLFARKRGHRVGLGRALMLSNMEFFGQPHSGLDDARNIARLLAQDSLLRVFKILCQPNQLTS